MSDTYEFKVQTCLEEYKVGEPNSKRDVMSLEIWDQEVPMWMRTFMGYMMKIWWQWNLMKQHQNERGIPGLPEWREINPEDGVYFLTGREVRALMYAGNEYRQNADEEQDEDAYQVRLAMAKLQGASIINQREEWMNVEPKTE